MRTVDRHIGGILLRTAVLLLAWSCGLPALRAQVPFVQAPPFDARAVAADDLQRDAAGELPLYGRSLPLLLGSDAGGTWSEERGERVWRMGLTSPGALAMEFLLDHVEVPARASMRLLSPGGDVLAHPFGLSPGGETSTPMVFADSCILEYREPLAEGGHGRFTVSHVVHAYRFLEGFGERAGDCHVNVACTPEADGWDGAIRATVRISVVVPQGTGWCTGTLVNNVRQDCAPYILSAYHCGRQSTTANFNQYKFYFNFQYANCTGGAYSTAEYVTGAQLKAYSDDYNPAYQGLGGSDFMLLRTNTDIPASFQPYWAGWDATTISTVADDGVCIHHPTGAPKSISSYTQTLTTGHPLASSGLMSHYKVVWAATQHGWGITEVGSSGAGLFKQKAGTGPVLIGTCTGNSSGMSCDNHAGYAYFGKMSYHWTQNPNGANIKLKPWLDPDNTGALVLGGSANPCSPAGVHDAPVTGGFRVYPNPGRDVFHVDLASDTRMAYRLTDAVGRTVRTGLLTGPKALLDTGPLQEGTYFLQTFGPRGNVVTTPLMVTR